jgi:hypothetical protein
MKKGAYIRISKLAHLEDAETKVGSWDKFKPGEDNPTGLPVEYWAEGIVHRDVKATESLIMIRSIRNGVSAGGVFNTSPIRTIDQETETKFIVHTQNSKYIVEVKAEPSVMTDVLKQVESKEE